MAHPLTASVRACVCVCVCVCVCDVQSTRGSVAFGMAVSGVEEHRLSRVAGPTRTSAKAPYTP